MKLAYTVTQQNYLDFNIHHIENSASMGKLARDARVRLPLLMALIGTAGSAYIAYRFGIERFPYGYFAGCLAVAALWYALYPWVYRKLLEKRLKAYFAEGNGKEYIGDFTLELLDDRLRTAGPYGATESLYGNVGKLAENKGCLYIYTGSVTAVILPLDSFSGEEAYREFRARLASRQATMGATP